MLLKPKNQRRPLKKPSFKAGCPFCFEWLPIPEKNYAVFTGDGALGGQCTNCKAFFVFEESGRLGGQAVLDLQAMASGGDLDQALTLRPGVDCDIKSKPLQEGKRKDPTGPQVWALKLGPPAPKRKPRRLKLNR